MPLIPDPRSKLARNFKEGLDLTDIMPGGMGMAAKMSSPATDVLSRWIRRFRKDKPPTVPLKNIEKALKNEYERRTKNYMPHKSFKEYLDTIHERKNPIESKSYMGPENLPVPGSTLTHRPLGVAEKEPFDELWNFLHGIRASEGRWNSLPPRITPRELYKEELARNWRKK